LGVISYQASCTKLEMRYAVSICGKHRGKWGVKQFGILKKVFVYGYSTRETGLIYSKFKGAGWAWNQCSLVLCRFGPLSF
jgi:hypothetical protein